MHHRFKELPCRRRRGGNCRRGESCHRSCSRGCPPGFGGSGGKPPSAAVQDSEIGTDASTEA
uniref:WAP domain-containing protein n=1 Tax=Hymenolepis diminuta TaxID=6216 RepID=A0A0R3SD60_HYMDI